MKASNWRETPTLGSVPYEIYRSAIEKNIDILTKGLDECLKTCAALKNGYKDMDADDLDVMKLLGAAAQLEISEAAFDLFKSNLMKTNGIFTGDVQVMAKGER